MVCNYLILQFLSEGREWHKMCIIIHVHNLMTKIQNNF